MRRFRLDDPPAPHEAHARLAAAHHTTFILESRAGPERLARHSIVGFAPTGTVRFETGALTVTGDLPDPDDDGPLDYLRRVQQAHAVNDHSLPFMGGFVGRMGAGFAAHLEPTLPARPDDGPDLIFGFYRDALVYDHVEGTCHYVHHGPDRLPLIQEALAGDRDPTPLRMGDVDCPVDDARFTAQVREAQRLIHQGECFQIVLSRPFTAPFQGPLTRFYDWLRDAAQVPYLYHLRFGGTAGQEDEELLGASPEMLVRVTGTACETFPIAGTRPITGDKAADQAAAQDLLADRKENAEHAMLVDLARNDLSRVCRPGTVQVPTLRSVEGFRHVQHMVSRVTGELEGTRDALDALGAVFPAGTVSGAPKLRALEHIHRMEETPRGPYSGAVAYFSLNGDLDTAITIRTLSARDGQATVQAGAGIVHRSDPQAEADETRHKAATLLEGIRTFQTKEAVA